MSFFIRNLLPVFLVINFSGAIADKKPAPPTLVEKWEFAEKLKRLAGQSEFLPKQVGHILKNLQDSLVVQFDCPKGMRVRRVAIVVKTRQIAWQKTVTIDEKPMQIPSGAVGYFIWHPVIAIGLDTMTVRSENFIMIAPTTPDGLSNRGRSPLPDEAVVYHELLHGELVLEAMTTRQWRTKACNGEFDLNSRDDQHALIPKFVNQYLQNLAALDDNVDVVKIEPPTDTRPDGRFQVQLRRMASLKSWQKWRTVFYYPDNSNVDPESFAVQVNHDKVIATGKLIDKSRAGFALVHFIPQRK
ncbi:MAG: hypothetical protein ACE5G1_03815 [bacterium]